MNSLSLLSELSIVFIPFGSFAYVLYWAVLFWTPVPFPRHFAEQYMVYSLGLAWFGEKYDRKHGEAVCMLRGYWMDGSAVVLGVSSSLLVSASARRYVL